MIFDFLGSHMVCLVLFLKPGATSTGERHEVVGEDHECINEGHEVSFGYLVFLSHPKRLMD